MATDNPGTRIKRLRSLAGLSQEELGRRVGVQRAAINKYEKGTVENIPIKTVEKIASVLDVPPTYILGWQELDIDNLAWEVKVIQGIKWFYGDDGVELMNCYNELNNKGRKRALQYLNELTMIYQDGEEDHSTTEPFQ